MLSFRTRCFGMPTIWRRCAGVQSDEQNVRFFSAESKGRRALKCDPDKTVELRERYAGVTKGYYAGDNLLWNSVYIQRDVPDTLIKELIDHSVEEVVKKLSKKQQQEYYAFIQ